MPAWMAPENIDAFYRCRLNRRTERTIADLVIHSPLATRHAEWIAPWM